jgi:hypothetical protein
MDETPGESPREQTVNWLRPFRSRVVRRETPLEADPFVPGAGPDFLCIGAQKAGTTWLYQQLAAHPDFWMPPQKELHYFNERGHVPIQTTPRQQDERDFRFLEKFRALGTKAWLDLPNYGQLFAGKGSLLSGDMTPAYSMLPDEIIALVLRCFPNLKVIFLARDPVERAWSQLSLGVRTGGIPAFDVTDPAQAMHHLLRPLVIQRSFPSMIAARWGRHVPAEQFQVYFFDDLKRDPARLRRSIIEFLGADPERASGQVRAETNVAATVQKLPLCDEVRARIAEFFADELKACAAELGGAAREWPSRYL